MLFPLFPGRNRAISPLSKHFLALAPSDRWQSLLRFRFMAATGRRVDSACFSIAYYSSTEYFIAAEESSSRNQG